MSGPSDDVPIDHITSRTIDPEKGDPISTPHGQAPQEISNPSDSEALFTMYLDRVIEEDRRMVESWKNNTDGMLTFTGLFSAVVATFLAVSVQTIQRNPQDTSSFYLAHIYQQLSTQSNGSQPSIPSSLTNPVEPFVPPTLDVWVNGLWFLSLVISLTCALVALLVQQWARRYLRVAYPLYHRPHKRARLRAFYARGVEELHVPLFIEAIPALLHISLFLFFAGLSVYLFSVHRTIFKVVTAWIGLCIYLYAHLTVLPIFRKNSPCSSPLSSWFSFCYTGIRHILFLLLFRFSHICMRLRSQDPWAFRIDYFSRSIVKTTEEYAFRQGPEIDYRSLRWTFLSLDEDADFEKYFERFSHLCDSETGNKLKLKDEYIQSCKEELSNALIGWMDRTLKSNLVEGFVNLRRMIIFAKAIETFSTSLFDLPWILRSVLFEDWHGLLNCVEFGLSMRNWTTTSNVDRVTSFYAQCVATLTISTIQIRDKRWIQLAIAQPSSRSLYDSGDHRSVLLANAIHIVRMSVETYSASEETRRNDILIASRKTLGEVCKFNLRYTSNELQHEFCDLWNKLLDMALTDESTHLRFVSVKMLKNIRKLFTPLHYTNKTFSDATDDWDQFLDNPKSYPRCTEDDHRSSSLFPDLQIEAPHTQSDAPTLRNFTNH